MSILVVDCGWLFHPSPLCGVAIVRHCRGVQAHWHFGPGHRVQRQTVATANEKLRLYATRDVDAMKRFSHRFVK